MQISAERRAQKAAAQKRYKQSAKGKITQARYYSSTAKRNASKRWRSKYAWKIAAHRMVSSAVKAGKLAKQPCEVCAKPNAFAHHDDYNRPLDVRWMCNYHHCEYHRSISR